jgi:dephospho-CoA kinase/inosine/xanthosine triphosphate pyrophosphatase family protein
LFDLFFLTSSRVKLDHIRYLLRDFSVNIRPPIDYGKPYEEPRIYDRDLLLSESLEDANRRLVRNVNVSSSKNDGLLPSLPIEDYTHLYQDRPFIIEDTSVIIEALSSKEEYPGLDVKYWMKETTFEALDTELRKRGNNRNVTVRSDIVLYLPKKLRNGQHFVQFTGISKGTITEKEFSFETNPMYPWLDNKTFNKWFVPGNETKPISCLPIKVANKYDFRLGAVNQLIIFLKSSHLLSEKPNNQALLPKQETFFDSPNIILCGPSCAGKSLLATHLSRQYGYYHIEASDFMHLSFYKKHGFSSSISIHDFALQALKDDPGIVARQVIDHIEDQNDSPIVITGFRSPKELTRFINSNYKYTYCYIDANPELRYQRCLARDRADKAKDFSKFLARDKKQINMGLSKIQSMLEFDLISNETSIHSYFTKFKEKYLTEYKHRPSIKAYRLLEKLKPGLSLEQSILITLFIDCIEHNEFRTTTEIAKLINEKLPHQRVRKGKRIVTSKNNVSRYFNQKNYPYYEVENHSTVNKFRISTTGASHTLRLLKKITS